MLSDQVKYHYRPLQLILSDKMFSVLLVNRLVVKNITIFITSVIF